MAKLKSVLITLSKLSHQRVAYYNDVLQIYSYQYGLSFVIYLLK